MISPVMVQATRGHFPESIFRGRAVVVDALGHIIRSWGDIQTPVFARSSLKLIQSLPLIESGAADAYHLTPEEIVLACSSHHGEEIHLRVLESWLRKLGKDERILECGIHRPLHLLTAKKTLNLRQQPTVLHNACSGKHLGFITTALHRNESIEGYVGRDHPVQRQVERAIAEMTGVDVTQVPHGTDGCGIPALALPLYNIALAMARFADYSHLHYPRQKAIKRILTDIVENPEMISGTNGFDTKVIKATEGRVISKAGAGAFMVGIIPSLGLGIALKIEDGNPKAAEIAFLAILRSLGVLDEALYEKIGKKIPIVTHRGKTVGFLEPTNFTQLVSETTHH